MTTTVGPETEEDPAEHWLNTGGIPVLSQDGIKSYPKRSDLRRAEARAAARRTSHTRPSGSRPSGHQSGHQRPPAPASAPRSAEATRRATLQTQYPHAMLPTPAVLPIPRTDPGRPAGINMPVPPPPSADAFHRALPQPPLVPLAVSTEWGLDLTTDPTAPEGATPEAPRRRIGRLHGTATRLLVMALVVGAEGVAVSQFADPFDGDSSASTAAFALDALQEQPSAQQTAAAQAEAAAEAERAEVTATTLKNLKDASPAKAKAAAAQSQKAEAAEARRRRAEAKAAKEKKEAAEKAAALAEAKAKAKAEAAASEPSATATTSSSSALSLANSRKNPQAAAKLLLTDRGWSSAQYTCLDSLWTRESSWNYQATNPSSGAYGIPQSLPGSKMASAGSDWKTNPVTQIRWGLDYISDRYGTPCGAWSHSESVGWY